jgi:twitching motility protein PilT
VARLCDNVTVLRSRLSRYYPVGDAEGLNMGFKELVSTAYSLRASDLHLEAGTPLVVRVKGELNAIGEIISASQLIQFGKELLGSERWNQFVVRGSADLSVNIGGTQCRINLFRTVRGVAVAVRLLSSSVEGLRACNLHPDLRKFTEPRTGLVVVSGPTGSGKSTTLAALVEEINASSARHIITVESPLEYVFSNRRSFIRQREIPTHSPSVEQAITDALRENPDVLVITEMRTPEVMRLTLNAAETGHLVLATMHSSTCAEALSRIAMSFAPEIQGSILAQIADSLVGVICQRLDFLSEYQLRVPRCEVLTASSAAKGTIRAGQFSQLATVIQSGGEHGMWSFDRYERWIAQKKDWLRPSPTAAAPPEHRGAMLAPTPAPTPIARVKAPPRETPFEIAIEAEETDLAELAKRIDEKTR